MEKEEHKEIFEDVFADFEEKVGLGEILWGNIDAEKKLIKQKRKRDIRLLRGAIVELTASKMLVSLHSVFVLDIRSRDIVEHLNACITLINKVIESFKKDGVYLKEVEELTSYVNADDDPLTYLDNVLKLLNTIYAKEENLENHANTIIETTKYAIQGVNCYVPNYTCNESKDNDEKIESQITKLRLVQNKKS